MVGHAMTDRELIEALELSTPATYEMPYSPFWYIDPISKNLHQKLVLFDSETSLATLSLLLKTEDSRGAYGFGTVLHPGRQRRGLNDSS